MSFFFWYILAYILFFFFFQAEDGIRDRNVTGVQTCALPIYPAKGNIGAWRPPIAQGMFLLALRTTWEPVEIEHASVELALRGPDELLVTPGVDGIPLEGLSESRGTRLRLVGGHADAHGERRGLDRHASGCIRKDGVQVAQVCVVHEERRVHRLKKETRMADEAERRRQRLELKRDLSRRDLPLAVCAHRELALLTAQRRGSFLTAMSCRRRI